ncbi:VOC family protein [Planococcus salinus]|uniref:VOC family protein n=1 Tax=Planococcus salinus TaxID=1848460 RepID=A0A3M8P7Q2_9BACL|nr:VOC family protein [Planococcus salinus]RNF39224.1 VOC family protein [Planococcus salinus]
MYLDHVVHFVDKTPQQTADFWQRLGYPALVGGQHLKWGTHNALLYGKDCYIEWLAIRDLQTAEDANHPLVNLFLNDRKGFGTVCLRTASIAEVNERLLADGIRTSGVMDAERQTSTGDLIRWKLLFIEEPISEGLPAPFFIEWEEDDETRYENLRSAGMASPASESMEIERCVFGVHDTEASEERWRTILGGDLQLENCLLTFQQTDRPQERLEQVRFKDGTQKVAFEEGVYCLPPSGNNKGSN